MKFQDKQVVFIDKDNKEHIIANKLSIANNPFERLQGLLGERELKEKHALLISPCNSIHMFFMKFPIDVIYLDIDFNIVKTVRNIKPWQVEFGHKKARYTLELPVGTIIDDIGKVLIR